MLGILSMDMGRGRLKKIWQAQPGLALGYGICEGDSLAHSSPSCCALRFESGLILGQERIQFAFILGDAPRAFILGGAPRIVFKKLAGLLFYFNVEHMLGRFLPCEMLRLLRGCK